MGFDPSWKVTFLDPRPEDEKLPLPSVRDVFLGSVPGLAQAVASMDAVARDLFYVHVQTRGLFDSMLSMPVIRGPEVLRDLGSLRSLGVRPRPQGR